MALSLRPVRLKRLSISLQDTAHFSTLTKALAELGDVNLRASVAKLPPEIRREGVVAVLSGWIRADRQREVTDLAMKTTEGRCEVSFSDPAHGEDVPSLLRHHRFLQPFEKLVKSFGVPSYNELDPTWFMVISFMLVFCFMFADVGHGLVLAFVGAAVFVFSTKAEGKASILNYVLESGSLIMVCGLSGAIGGVLLGEFFGYEAPFISSKLVLPSPIRIVLPFHPVEKPMQMFRLSLLVGALHIMFGLLLNVANKLMTRQFRAAFFEAACWLWFYVGLMYSVFSYGLDLLALGGSPIMLWGILLPLLLMLFGRLSIEGLDGLVFFVEAVISTVSNTISYLRILALALAHSIISALILELGGHNLLIAVIGSLPAIALEGLIVFIHSTRLMWVEWFSKFYQGGGIAFEAGITFDWEVTGLQPEALEVIAASDK